MHSWPATYQAMAIAAINVGVFLCGLSFAMWLSLRAHSLWVNRPSGWKHRSVTMILLGLGVAATAPFARLSYRDAIQARCSELPNQPMSDHVSLSGATLAVQDARVGTMAAERMLREYELNVIELWSSLPKRSGDLQNRREVVEFRLQDAATPYCGLGENPVVGTSLCHRTERATESPVDYLVSFSKTGKRWWPPFVTVEHTEIVHIPTGRTLGELSRFRYYEQSVWSKQAFFVTCGDFESSMLNQLLPQLDRENEMPTH